MTEGTVAESIFERTIRADQDPKRPRAMPWQEYESYVSTAWTSALTETKERVLQRCIERHPCLLGVDSVQTPSYPSGHHGVWMDAVISQPPLWGYQNRVPDFMWITSDSSTVVATCVEIERQDKYWFNKAGTPTADLNQARDQIDEWRIWFRSCPKDDFFEAYRLPDVWRRRNFAQRYFLLYGRRSEFDDHVGSRHGNEAHRLNRKRGELLKHDSGQRTLDALHPDHASRGLVTIRLHDHQLEVVSVPPVFKTGPHMRLMARYVEGLPLGINRMEPHPSQERLDYLTERVAYWAKAPEFGAFGPGSE
jgi:hypothetical protein